MPLAIAAEVSKHRLMWMEDPSSVATLGWFQSGGEAAAVYYGSEDHGDEFRKYSERIEAQRRVEVHDGSNQFVTLRGLRPDTEYFYVVVQGEEVSRRLKFRTAPAKAQPFTFINGGDSRSNRWTRQELNKLVAKLKPLCVSFSGDMVNVPSDEEWDTWFTDWQLTIDEDGRMVPIIPHRGNHENKRGVMTQEFDTPKGSYFSFNVAGNLMRYYALNSEIPAMGKQGDWLKADLETHAEQVNFLVAGYHKPMRPHVAKKKEGDNTYQWAELFYQHGMDLVFESDSHCLKRTQPLVPSTSGEEGFMAKPNDANATVYSGEGSWGAPLREANDGKSWTLDCAMLYGFDWVQVSPEKIALKTVVLTKSGAEGIDSVRHLGDFQSPRGLVEWNAKGGKVMEINADND